MDQSSFDRIARLLGGAASRRSGMKAALGAAFGLGALDAEAKSHAGKDKDRGHGNGNGNGRPEPEGPCGNGSRKDNICTKDKDCCTGICNTDAGKKNAEGKGRCRCMKKGKPCKATKNCCNTLTCNGGVCGAGGPVPTSDPCVVGVDTCADSKASCTTYDPRSGGPVGDYCLLPYLETICAKDADCAVNSCFTGICITCSCGGCPANDACTSPTVCATCTHTTVQAAIDAAVTGDTILIAAGSYNEDLTIAGKDLNLIGCPSGAAEVILKNASYDTRTLNVTDASNLNISDIVIQGYNDSVNSRWGGGIQMGATGAGGNLCIGIRSRVENCIAPPGGAGGGINFEGNTTITTMDIRDVTIIQNNHADTYGGGLRCGDANITISHNAQIINNTSNRKGGGIGTIYNSLGSTISIHDRVKITGNTATGQGGGIFHYGGGTNTASTVRMLITDDVLIDSNSSGDGGGGIGLNYANADDREQALIQDRVQITNNTALKGGGIAAEGTYITLENSVRVSGNTAANTLAGKGGGVYIYNQNAAQSWDMLVMSENTEISGNTADSYGGGVYAKGCSVAMSGNSVIKSNT
ncbi:MAG: hypothetical protein ACR2J8_14025, partial [Thermomicrobiales bacterium]